MLCILLQEVEMCPQDPYLFWSAGKDPIGAVPQGCLP
jgi:hypothetical protein